MVRPPTSSRALMLPLSGPRPAGLQSGDPRLEGEAHVPSPPTLRGMGPRRGRRDAARRRARRRSCPIRARLRLRHRHRPARWRRARCHGHRAPGDDPAVAHRRHGCVRVLQHPVADARQVRHLGRARRIQEDHPRGGPARRRRQRHPRVHARARRADRSGHRHLRCAAAADRRHRPQDRRSQGPRAALVLRAATRSASRRSRPA